MFNFITKWFKKDEVSNKWIFGTMLGSGIAALIASFVLSIEKIHILQNPDASLSCDFSLILSCSTVMQTWQSAVFGFPNMLIGLMAYSVVITVAVLALSGANFKRWFLIAANVGFLLGAIFAYWLFFQSLYVIEVLCPWCLVVTFTTTLIFATMTHYNLRENTFNLPKKTNKTVQDLLAGQNHQLIVAMWFVLMIALVFIKFGMN